MRLRDDIVAMRRNAPQWRSTETPEPTDEEGAPPDSSSTASTPRRQSPRYRRKKESFFLTEEEQYETFVADSNASIKENTEAVASLEAEVTERARAYSYYSKNSYYSSKQVYYRKQFIFGCQRFVC